MVTAVMNVPVVENILVIGAMEPNMEVARAYILMELCILANSRITFDMDKELVNGRTEAIMLVSGITMK